MRKQQTLQIDRSSRMHASLVLTVTLSCRCGMSGADDQQARTFRVVLPVATCTGSDGIARSHRNSTIVEGRL
jgi:hypothetical protein